MASSELEKVKTPTTTPAQRRVQNAAAPAREPDRAAELRNLQRIAGNRGLTQLVAQRQAAAGRTAPVQRLTTTAADLDKGMGGSNTRGLLGKGGSSYAEIRKLLAKYEKAKAKQGNETQLILLLENIGRLSANWLNTHKGPQSERHAILRALVDQAPAESLALGRKQSELRYLEGMIAQPGFERAGVKGPVQEGFKHGFGVTNPALGLSSYSNYESNIQSSKRLAGDDPTSLAAHAEDEKRWITRRAGT